ncbi:PLP-dependent aminotransferase family protein [Ferrimonas sediminicola]|uniref:PLP-dependent aminotransferase family protein n=1 Tax=Ferrimonas sediminicola TaxID=2569538 RepID=A0A4U1BIS5_9GAMM|nr:PLP-dependent aminotransferase family protein [Ferrimonas sediminicola]TKB50469.1 PLP-dependent aminotransferase family protein [Ferrimonas sediminicola]
MTEYLYQRLASALRQQIEQGVWQAGDRLPSIRALSSDHRMAKISVQKALHTLEASGLIEARARSGYFVSPRAVRAGGSQTGDTDSPRTVNLPQLFHEIMARSAAFDLCPGAQLGSPAPHLLRLNRHLGRALRHQPGRKAIYYGDPDGLPTLREQIGARYRSRGCPLDPAEIAITGGCQNSLFLALMACCQPGDTVAVESPAFYGVLQLLQQLGLKVVEIPACPVRGVRAEELEAAVRRWQVKVCVLTPSYATPTGATIPVEEQRKLVALTRRYPLTLVEDDIYGDLGFHLQAEPLKRFDTLGKVILCGSFSKSLSRDLRLGWISGGQFHRRIVQLKLINQLSVSQATQEGLTSFLAEGHYKRHLASVRRQLMNQRDQLVDAITEEWSGPYAHTLPEGGLSLWLELSPAVDTKAAYQALLAHNIVITPGALFTTSSRFDHCLRLSFCQPVTGVRRQAIARIASVLGHQSP